MQKKANERQEGHQGERMIRKIPWMIFGITLFSSSLGYGEEVLLYSYSRISERDGLWGVMPVTTEVSERSPERLFEALKRRKMPTYGGTVYDGNRVTIDESKCMYGSVISSEVDATFTAHGFGTPEYVCGGEKVASAQGALMAYMPVMPLWQAMTAESFNGVSLIAAGDAYLSPSEFVSRLKSHDKALTRAVEKGLESPHDFEKTGLMRGMLRHGFTDAEKRIAKLLESRDETTVIAALTTLSQTKNASTVKAIRTLLTEEGAQRVRRASVLLSASDAGIREDALVIMLSSGADVYFTQAMAQIDQTGNTDILARHDREIFKTATPRQAQIVAQRLISGGQTSRVSSYLKDATYGETSGAVAAIFISSVRGRESIHGLSLLLESPDRVLAYEALERLVSLGDGVSAADWMRGLRSPERTIQFESIHALEHLGAQEAQECTRFADGYVRDENVLSIYEPVLITVAGAHCDLSQRKDAFSKNAMVAGVTSLSALPKDAPLSSSLLAAARLEAPDGIATMTQQAFHDDVGVRRSVAYGVRYLDERGDSLHHTMIQDGDATVARLAMISLSGRTGRISAALVKSVIARAGRDSDLRLAALYALPYVISEETAQSITTFAGNEMFDGDDAIRIAAIRALSRVAVRSADPVIGENAVTSLALTAQDRDPVIVYHTLLALSRAPQPSAAEIVKRARSQHPDIMRKIDDILGR